MEITIQKNPTQYAETANATVAMETVNLKSRSTEKLRGEQFLWILIRHRGGKKQV